MVENGLRRDNRNDPVAQKMATDPDISTVVHDRRVAAMEKSIDEAIQSTDERKLTGWVTVATWEEPDGAVAHSVIGDGHSSPLELKGYLHDGIWVAAHSE